MIPGATMASPTLETRPSEPVLARTEHREPDTRVRDEPGREPTPPAVSRPTEQPGRLRSLDAYRGFIMLAMASGGLGFAVMARNYPDNALLQFLGYEFDHVDWTGCAFWDLIQPSFMFMVGV